MFMITHMETGEIRVSTEFASYDDAVEALGGEDGDHNAFEWLDAMGCDIIWYDDDAPVPTHGIEVEEFDAVVVHDTNSIRGKEANPKVKVGRMCADPTYICYQCEEPVPYLFGDGRGSCCTRLTRGEIEGTNLEDEPPVCTCCSRAHSLLTDGLCMACGGN